MKVKVNQNACISCGACEAICPEVFVLNDEGLSTVKEEIKDKEIKEELKEQVVDAIESCPTSAIEEITDKEATEES